MTELLNEIPSNGFPIVSFPYRKASKQNSYISFGISYFEHSLSGTFFSQSYVTFSPEHKLEFATRLKMLSEIARENQIMMLALKRACEDMKQAKELCSILESNMTDEEYEQAYKEYEEETSQQVRHLRKLKSEEIAIEAKILLKVLEQELSSDEIAELLNLDVSEVERALQVYKKSLQ